MKVLMLNGSPHTEGNTALALEEMAKIFAEENIETETVHLGSRAIRGCSGCGACYKTGKCVFDDGINELAAQFREKLGFYSCTVPTFEQYTLTELINSGDFERHINRARRNKRKGRSA